MASMEAPHIEGFRGVLVQAGLATPASRAFVVGTFAGIGAYMLKMPRAAFDDKGEMRPLAFVSSAPTATNTHFLVVPVTAAALAYLFT